MNDDYSATLMLPLVVGVMAVFAIFQIFHATVLTVIFSIPVVLAVLAVTTVIVRKEKLESERHDKQLRKDGWVELEKGTWTRRVEETEKFTTGEHNELGQSGG